LQTSKKKVYLFDDDDDDDDNVNDNQENLISDFKLKLRFEGKKGKKVKSNSKFMTIHMLLKM